MATQGEVGPDVFAENLSDFNQGFEPELTDKMAEGHPGKSQDEGFEKTTRLRCGHRWNLRDVLCTLQRAVNVRKLRPKLLERPCAQPAVLPLASPQQSSVTVSHMNEAAPLVPLSCDNEDLLFLCPPSDDEDSGSDADFKRNGTKPQPMLLRAKPIVAPNWGKGPDVKKVISQSCTNAILPAGGLQCNGCISAQHGEDAELVLPTKAPQVCITGEICSAGDMCTDGSKISRSSSVPDLESFGIERQFELSGGGAGWVRSAAEDQPEKTVAFPAPPDQASARLFHSGHHARTKRRLRKLSQLPSFALRRSRSLPAKHSSVQYMQQAEGSTGMVHL